MCLALAPLAATAFPALADPPALVSVSERGASGLVSMRLGNGLFVVIDPRPGRRTVYCEIGFRVGSRNESLEHAGLSHLLEHLLFKEGEAPGARKNPAFSRIRAAGGEVNATTSFETTSYYCDVHADAFEEGWRGLSNLVTAAGFDEKDVEVEREIVLQEAALDKNNPLSIAAYSILDRLFPDDPLSQPVIGFKKTLRRIRLADVERYYERYYRPENAWALVVGDVDARAASLIATTLEGWRGGTADQDLSTRANADSTASPGARPTFPPVPVIADEKRFVFHTFTHQVYYGLGILTGGEESADRTALDLLSRILAGGRSSRLRRRIVDEEGLTGELETGSLDLSNIGVYAAGGAVSPEKSDRLRAILREEFGRLASEPVTESELAVARTLLAADLVRAFESNAGIASFRSARLLYGQPVSRDIYLDEASRLTSDDLARVAARCFAPERLREVEVRPARGFGKVLAAVRYLLFRRL